MRTIAFAVLLAALASPGLAASACPDTLVLAAESETKWSISCGSSPLVTFDPLKLAQFDFDDSTAAVELVPPTAPQPTSVKLPNATPLRIKALKSSTLKQLTFAGPVLKERTAETTVDEDAFAGLSNLWMLTIDRTPVKSLTKPWSIPATLQRLEIAFTSIESFDAVVDGGTLNITRLDLSTTKLKTLPGVLFNSAPLDTVNLYGTEFPPQTLSRKRFERLQTLVANHSVSFSAEDFTGSCAGAKETLVTIAKSVLLCVVPTGDGDDLVAVDTPAPTEAPTEEPKTPETKISQDEKKEIEKVIKEVSKTSAAVRIETCMLLMAAFTTALLA